MIKIAFIGLGVMGFPMAGHLKLNDTYDICVYNRTMSKAEEWVNKFGGKLAKTPKEAVIDADFIFSCVGNDDDLKNVTIGDDGAFSNIKKGAIFIDNTTASAEIARELYKIAKQSGFAFIDAPVSGGQAGAENGTLTVMCGGDQDIFNRAKPIIKKFAKQVMLIGDSGAGQLTKMCNQICIAGLVQGLSEAMNFGKLAGLDMENVIKVIGGGAAQSWQMDNRAKTMVDGEFDFGFAVDWMRKDLSICLNEANNNGARLPITALIDQFYSQLQANGHNRWDTSSLIHLLKNNDKH